MHEDSAGAGGHWDGHRWSRADFALLRKAAREKWGVPDGLKTEALFQAARTLADPEASHRDRLAASKLLLDADRHDLAEERLVLDRARLDLLAKPPDRAEARDAWQDLKDEIDADA